MVVRKSVLLLVIVMFSLISSFNHIYFNSSQNNEMNNDIPLLLTNTVIDDYDYYITNPIKSSEDTGITIEREYSSKESSTKIQPLSFDLNGLEYTKTTLTSNDTIIRSLDESLNFSITVFSNFTAVTGIVTLIDMETNTKANVTIINGHGWIIWTTTTINSKLHIFRANFLGNSIYNSSFVELAVAYENIGSGYENTWINTFTSNCSLVNRGTAITFDLTLETGNGLQDGYIYVNHLNLSNPIIYTEGSLPVAWKYYTTQFEYTIPIIAPLGMNYFAVYYTGSSLNKGCSSFTPYFRIISINITSIGFDLENILNSTSVIRGSQSLNITTRILGDYPENLQFKTYYYHTEEGNVILTNTSIDYERFITSIFSPSYIHYLGTITIISELILNLKTIASSTTNISIVPNTCKVVITNPTENVSRGEEYDFSVYINGSFNPINQRFRSFYNSENGSFILLFDEVILSRNQTIGLCPDLNHHLEDIEIYFEIWNWDLSESFDSVSINISITGELYIFDHHLEVFSVNRLPETPLLWNTTIYGNDISGYRYISYVQPVTDKFMVGDVNLSSRYNILNNLSSIIFDYELGEKQLKLYCEIWDTSLTTLIYQNYTFFDVYDDVALKIVENSSYCELGNTIEFSVFVYESDGSHWYDGVSADVEMYSYTEQRSLANVSTIITDYNDYYQSCATFYFYIPYNYSIGGQTFGFFPHNVSSAFLKPHSYNSSIVIGTYPEIYIETPNYVIRGEEISFNVSLTSDGFPVYGGVLDFGFSNGTVISSFANIDGHIKINYLVPISHPLGNSEPNYRVSFYNSATFNETYQTFTFNVLGTPTLISIETNSSDIIIGSTIQLTGKVVDEIGIGISSHVIHLYHDIDEISWVISNSTGFFSFYLTIPMNWALGTHAFTFKSLVTSEYTVSSNSPSVIVNLHSLLTINVPFTITANDLSRINITGISSSEVSIFWKPLAVENWSFITNILLNTQGQGYYYWNVSYFKGEIEFKVIHKYLESYTTSSIFVTPSILIIGEDHVVYNTTYSFTVICEEEYEVWVDNELLYEGIVSINTFYTQFATTGTHNITIHVQGEFIHSHSKMILIKANEEVKITIEYPLIIYIHDVTTFLVTVNDLNLNPVESAPITVYVNGITVFAGVTNEIGQLSFEFSFNLLSNFNVTVYSDFNAFFNKGIKTLIITTDSKPSTVSILSPQNDTYGSEIIINLDGNGSIYWYYILGMDYSNLTYTGIQNRLLQSGNYTIFVYVDNGYGKISTSLEYFTIDAEPPSITCISPNNNSKYSNSQINITLHSKGLIYYFIQGIDNINRSYEYTHLRSLSDGIHTIFIFAEDKYKNIISTKIIISIDTSVPELTIVSPSYKMTNSSLIDIILECEGNCTILFNLYPLDTMNRSYNSIAYQLALSDGDYILYAYAIDDAGNTGRIDHSFTIDTTAPILKILSPSNITYITTSINFSFISDDSVPLYYYLSTVTSEFLIFSNEFTLELTDGFYSLTVFSEDDLGNERIISLYFTIDTTPPEIVINSPKDTTYLVNNIWLNFSSLGDIKYQILPIDAIILPYTTVYSRSLADGTYQCQITSSDKHGNNKSITIEFVINTQVPELSLSTPLLDSYDNQEQIDLSIASNGIHTWYMIENYKDKNHSYYFPLSFKLPVGNFVIKVFTNDSFGRIVCLSHSLQVNDFIFLDNPSLEEMSFGSYNAETRIVNNKISNVSEIYISINGTIYETMERDLYTYSQKISLNSPGRWNITLVCITTSGKIDIITWITDCQVSAITEISYDYTWNYDGFPLQLSFRNVKIYHEDGLEDYIDLYVVIDTIQYRLSYERSSLSADNHYSLYKTIFGFENPDNYTISFIVNFTWGESVTLTSEESIEWFAPSLLTIENQSGIEEINYFFTILPGTSALDRVEVILTSESEIIYTLANYSSSLGSKMIYNWSLENLSLNYWNISVKIYDIYNGSSIFNFILDLQDAFPEISEVNYEISENNLQLSATVTDDHEIKEVYLLVDEGRYYGFLDSNQLKISVSLSIGSHNISLIARDSRNQQTVYKIGIFNILKINNSEENNNTNTTAVNSIETSVDKVDLQNKVGEFQEIDVPSMILSSFGILTILGGLVANSRYQVGSKTRKRLMEKYPSIVEEITKRRRG